MGFLGVKVCSPTLQPIRRKVCEGLLHWALRPNGLTGAGFSSQTFRHRGLTVGEAERMIAKTLERAYQFWRHQFYGELETDLKVEPFLKLDATECAWLTKARVALQRKLGGKHISPQNFAKYERREKRGNITLNTLRKAAAAIDCELVYAIRPVQKTPFSHVLWKEILPVAMTDRRVLNFRSEDRHKMLTRIAGELLYDPGFRKSKCWSERKTTPQELKRHRVRVPTNTIKNSPSFRGPSPAYAVPPPSA
jgi:hypothetical protein